MTILIAVARKVALKMDMLSGKGLSLDNPFSVTTVILQVDFGLDSS